MSMLKLLSAFLSIIVLVSIARAADDPDLQPIFNGKDLTGWKVPKENPWWKVVDGVLVGENDEKKRGNELYTEKAYKDVVIETEVRFGDDIDSGIYVRKPVCQVQLGVSRSLKVDMTGSIYVGGKGYVGKAKGVDKLLKLNEWNRMRIEAKGNRFKVWLNGEQVLEYESDAHPEAAPIGLQIHGGVAMKVEFRNLRAKEL